MEQRKFKGRSLFAFPQDYTVVDIETNGLSADVCEIIEVSAIKCRGYEVTDTFSSLIKPTEPIGWFITNLTGITDDMVSHSGPELRKPKRRIIGYFAPYVARRTSVGTPALRKCQTISKLRRLGASSFWVHNAPSEKEKRTKLYSL